MPANLGATPPTPTTDKAFDGRALDDSFMGRIKRALDLEAHFESTGRVIVRHPIKTIAVGVVLTLIALGGNAMLEDENRAEKLWVPRGALALDQKDYVDEVWPGDLSFNAYIAYAKEEGANMLDAEYIKELAAIDDRVRALVVDGDKIKREGYQDVPSEDWEDLEGKFAYEEDKKEDVQQKCFAFGPKCGELSVLELLKSDDKVIKKLKTSQVLTAINFWEDQEYECLVTIARSDSPCIDASAWEPSAKEDACQTIERQEDRDDCRRAYNAYCLEVCPGDDSAPCRDSGCETVLELRSASQSVLANNGTFNYPAIPVDPADVSTIASSGPDGPETKSGGKVVAATHLRGAYLLRRTEIVVDGSTEDPVADAWEAKALCELGIPNPVYSDCPESELIEFTASFSRSFGDEFGAAINADIGALAVSFVGILVYLAIFLSACDPVHSMLGMSLVTVLAVLGSFGACRGIGGYIGLRNAVLNNNIPFLLLGLGVDDAFVLAGEFAKATTDNPGMAAEERVVMAIKYGGVSILITSLTDALAFLVGSNTALPALSWFCAFAGIGVLWCFFLQLALFAPCLLLNARRAEANRYDLVCCVKSKEEHPIDAPRGGCCLFSCCGFKFPTNTLEKAMNAFAKRLVTAPGKILVLIAFAGTLAGGVYGVTQIYADFKLEWFFPDNSYVNNFIALNDEYFASGTPFSVYTVEGDYFKLQDELKELGNYLRDTKFVDQDEGVEDWARAFRRHAQDTSPGKVDDDGFFESDLAFYGELVKWYHNEGSDFSSNIQFVDSNCEDADKWRSTECKAWKGLKATRIGASLDLNFTDTGTDRYNTMVQLREDITAILPGAFPYSPQFLFWEETGVILAELVRNLIVCGVVILVIIGLLIPNPRISVWVIVCIFMTVVDVVGYLHWWDVTISGVSTIYILISVGLAVDYSAHIAHIFAVSTGTPDERAVGALTRIGPSVFNAVASTMVAVIVLSFSQSFVFRVFFKAICLTVVLGGVHGLVLLPVVLSILGGSKQAGDEAPAGGSGPGADKRAPRLSGDETEEASTRTG